jgi:hypothetical protein
MVANIVMDMNLSKKENRSRHAFADVRLLFIPIFVVDKLSETTLWTILIDTRWKDDLLLF